MEVHNLVLAHFKYTHIHYKRLLENHSPKGYKSKTNGQSLQYKSFQPIISIEHYNKNFL